MIKMRRTYTLSMFPLIYLALLVAVPDHAFGQGRSVGIPEHASAKRYGSGWECDRGYRVDKDACIAINVPSNGYLTDASYGSGWKCDRGYRADRGACVAFKIPENAHLNYSGNDWNCNRPYRKQQGGCALP